MALAAVIFGNWHPFGAMGAALFFGLAKSLSVVSGGIPLLQDIPQVFLLIAPNVLTILALVGLIDVLRAPRANGVPYIKESRYKGDDRSYFMIFLIDKIVEKFL